MTRCLSVLLMLLCCASARTAVARDFRDPQQRTTQGTAYTLAPRQWSLDAGLLGIENGDLMGRAGLGYGFRHGVSLDTNFAHTGTGILNVQAKWNFLDRPGLGLGASLAMLWGHGPWMWIFAEDLAALDAVAFPVSLFASWLPLAWLQLDLELGYRHAEVFGNVAEDSLFVDARLGLRSFSTRLATRFYLVSKLELVLEARLPLYSALPGQLETEATLAEGVVVGVRSAGYRELTFQEVFGVAVHLRSAIAKTTFISASLHYGRQVEVLYGHLVWPGIGLEHRF